MRRSVRRESLPGARASGARGGLAVLRLGRGTLLATTALQAGFALAFIPDAAAQPASDARPQGGTVVAGQASIARGANNTVITQASDRAAIDWRSFDIGRDQAVTFRQPAPSSVTLNRVTGPNPSEIAGRIQANGQVVVINGAGVVFHQGAQVEAQSFVASTADTTNAAFMAGRMQFDRPGRPTARIENRGEITVRDTGLAALVAPSVANHGTIRARLGTVVLGGAETHTIDLHGDGLVSFDVTGQVRSVPAGADGRPAEALVTNTGTVLAEGGTVLMTARAADGLVQQLVSAGGTVRADSAGARTGTIEVSGVGGGIRVIGTVAAEGRRAGERGGTVVVNGPGQAALGETARVVASGQAGGGTVAVGTTAARARNQGGGVPTGAGRRATISAGARIEADATVTGNGGRVAVLSTERTVHAGAISARGGPQGGNGGQVEVSGAAGLSLTGTVDTIAPMGRIGTLLLDPRDLTITGSATGEIGTNAASPQVGAGDGGTEADATLANTTLQSLLGTSSVRLEATRDILVNAPVEVKGSSNSLTLAAGRNVTVGAAISLKGDITLLASDTAIAGRVETGAVQVNAAVTSSGGAVLLRSLGASGSVAFGAGGTAGAATRLALVTDSMTLPTTAGTLSAPMVEIAPNSGIELSFGAGASSGLKIGSIAALDSKVVTSLRLGAATLSGTTATTLAASTRLAGDLTLSGVNLDLRATGTVGRSGGTLSGVNTLTGEAGTDFIMAGTGHGIGTLGAVTATTGEVRVRSGNDLTVASSPTAGTDVTIRSDAELTVAAPVSAPGDLVLTGRRVITQKTAPLSGDTILLTGTATGGGAAVQLNAAVTAATRIGILADNFDRGGQILTTDTTGSVEISRNSAGALTITGFDGISTGTLRLGAVTQAGASEPTLTATSLAVSGAVGVTPGFTALDLRSSGAITQGGALDTTGVTLSASAASIALGNAANKIDTVGALTASAGNLNLRTATALAVNGGVDAVSADASLQAAGNLTVAAAISAKNSTLLQSGGALTIQATGEVSGAAVSLAAGSGGIAVAGPVSATGTLTVMTSGAVTGDGQITAGTLAGSVGSLSLGGTSAVDVEAIGDLTAAGTLTLTTKGAVQVAGALAAGTANAADLSLATASGLLTVASTGSVATGTPSAGGGAITLAGAGGVSLKGDVAARSNGLTLGNVTITAPGGGIVQAAGTVTAGAGATLTLTAKTGVNQTGGVFDAPLLAASASAAGAAISLAGANRLDEIGTVTAPGSVTLNNAIGLKVTGPVSAGRAPAGAGAPDAAGEIRITAAGALTVSGALSAGQFRAAGAPDVAGSIMLRSDAGFLRSGAASAAAIDVESSATLSTVRIGTEGGRIEMQGGDIDIAAALAVPTGGSFAIAGESVAIGGGILGAGALSAPGGRIEIRTDALTLEGIPLGGFNLSALGGTVALAPFTAGTAVSLGGVGAGLDITADALSRIALGGILGTGVLEIGTTDAGDLTLLGPMSITLAPTLRLLSGGSISAASGAVLAAARLEGAAGGTINLDAPGGPHLVGTLGDLSAGGTLAFRALSGLDVAGDVTGASVSLATGPGTLRVLPGGSVSAADGGTVTLASDGMSFQGKVQAPNGTVRLLPVTTGLAMTLGGTGGLSLLQSDLGQVSAGSLLLGGTDEGGAVAGSLSLAGAVDLTGRADRLRLLVDGAVSDAAGGSLTVARLGDSVDGDVLNATSLTLSNSGNAIGALDAFTTSGTFSLTSVAPLTIAGPLVAGGSISVIGAAGAGALSVSGTVAAGTIGGAASASGGDLSLRATSGDLVVTGTALARRGTDPIALGGSVALRADAGAVATGAAASVTAQSTASVVAKNGITLSGSLAAADRVAISSFGPGSDVTLASGATLQAAAGEVQIGAADAVALEGTVTAAGSTLRLSAGGAVSGSGTVHVEALTGSAGSLALTGETNRIARLVNLAATKAGIALAVVDALSIKGTVSSAGDVTLDAATIEIAAGALLNAPGQFVALTADAGISAPGRIAAGSLAGNAGTGAATFSGLSNAVDTLGDLSTGTSVLFRNATALAVAGTVAAPDGVEIVSTAAGGSALALTGTARASGGAVRLQATNGDLALAGTVEAAEAAELLATLGTVRQSAGLVTGASVLAQAGTALTQTGGSIEATATDIVGAAPGFALGGQLDAARDILLSATSSAGSLGGEVAAARNLTVSAAGGLTLAGTLSAGQDATMTAGGGVSQAGMLSAPGSILLRTAGGDLSLSGDVEAGAAAQLVATLGAVRQTAGSVTGASVMAQAGTTLTQTGGSIEPGSIGASGTLDAPMLTGRSGGDAVMSGANRIGTLGAFAAGELLSLANAGALEILGPVFSTGTIRLNVAGALTLMAGPGTYTLDAPVIELDAASVEQIGGALRARLLDAGSAGAFTLGSAGNRIGALAVTSEGDLLFVADGALTLSGPVIVNGDAEITAAGALTVPGGILVQAGGELSMTAPGITTAGTLSATRLALSATAGDLIQSGGSIGWSDIATLTAPGSVLQGGGVLRGAPGARLTGSAGNNASFLSAGNDVSQLGTFTTGNGFALATSGDVSVAGALAAGPGALRLVAGGGIGFLSIPVTAGSGTIITGGGVAQAGGGSFTFGGPFSVSAGGAVALNGSVIASSAGIVAGSLSQTAGGRLAIGGPLALSALGDVALDGSVTASTANLASGGSLSQDAGGLLATAGALTLSAVRDMRLDGTVAGDPIQLSAGRDIIQTGTGSLSTGTLNVSAGGDATFAGALTAGLLTGSAGGALVLDGSAIRPATVRDLSAGAYILLRTDGPLRVDGSLRAPSILVQAAGQLDIGDITVTTSGTSFSEAQAGYLLLRRLPEPLPGAPGAVLETGSSTLTAGTITVVPLGTPNATLALRLPATGGLLTFTRLKAPSTDAILDLGMGGRATGEIQLRNLTVLGGGGGTELTGTVRGFAGQAAASVTGLGPQLEPGYRINNCPLASINCVQLVVRLPVSTDRLRELGTIEAEDDRDDPDIFVPNVAERDY